MKTKKAQSELITTVLIILLVLAAVVIVWQVVQGTVKKGGEAVTAQSGCIGLNMDISAVNLIGTSLNQLEVKVTRKAGGPTGAVTLKLLVDGEVIGSGVVGNPGTTLSELESTTLAYAGYAKTTKPAKTEIAATTTDGTNCNVVDCSGTGC